MGARMVAAATLGIAVTVGLCSAGSSVSAGVPELDALTSHAHAGAQPPARHVPVDRAAGDQPRPALTPSVPPLPVKPKPKPYKRPRTGPLVIDVVGDSIGWNLVTYRAATPGLVFRDHTMPGCGLVRGGPYRYFGQWHAQSARCDQWPTKWARAVRADRPDEVLLVVGRWETMNRVHSGRWTHVGDRAFDKYLSHDLDRAIKILGATGARVVVATEAYNRRGLTRSGGLFPEDHPGRVTRWNALVRAAVKRHRGAKILDLSHKLSPAHRFTWRVDGVKVRSDGVHLTREGVRWLTPWLAAALRADARH